MERRVSSGLVVELEDASETRRALQASISPGYDLYSESFTTGMRVERIAGLGSNKRSKVLICSDSSAVRSSFSVGRAMMGVEVGGLVANYHEVLGVHLQAYKPNQEGLGDHYRHYIYLLSDYGDMRNCYYRCSPRQDMHEDDD